MKQLSAWGFTTALAATTLCIAGQTCLAQDEDSRGYIRLAQMQQAGEAARKAPAAPLPTPKPRVPSYDALDRMIGQMIMVGFRGRSARDPGVRTVRRQLHDGLVGGVMLMSHNISGKAQLKALTHTLKQATAGGLPALIAVDQEGGWVQRLKAKNGFAATASARAVASRYTAEKAGMTVYTAMARQLAKSGINVNFGPVLDLDLKGKRNPIIGKLGRSYGKDPKKVIAYATWFSAAHRHAHIITTGKHFPGHGSSLVDSHKGFTDISRTWKPSELSPYRELAKNPDDMPMVMVGHLYHPRFSDGAGLPTSLSAKAIQRSLRQDLRFRGVVITDDMEMGAIRKNFPFRTAVLKAVQAGNDILLYSNTAKSDPNLPAKIHRIIRNAVDRGLIPRQRIESAYGRIKSMKGQWLGIRKTALND